MKTHFAKFILFALSVCFCSFANPDNPEELPLPEIKCGTAKITGQLNSHANDVAAKTVTFTISNPVTGTVRHSVLTDKEGKFFFEVDTGTNLSICGVASDINPDATLMFILKNDGETTIEVTFDEDSNIEDVKLTGCVDLSKDDILYSAAVMTDAIFHMTGWTAKETLYDKSFDYFLDAVENEVRGKLNMINADPRLSEKMKQYLTKESALFMYLGYALPYKEMMYSNYINTNDQYAGCPAGEGAKRPDMSEIPEIQTPTRHYYAFLGKLNLNDPLCLYCAYFPQFIEKILRNEVLNIPPIVETPVDIWLGQVRAILADLVGFNDGIFYDVLVGNAYAMQLNNESKPLSGRQIENIKTHYKGGEMEKILLRKNAETVQKASEQAPLVVNETPDVSKEKLLDAIVAKYEGKAVMVDFWATWCGPCMEAMKETHDLKYSLRNRPIVFVYVTGPSSPSDLWNEKIKGIGGEHYRLTEEEWEYIYDTMDVGGIPTFLFYDRHGVLQDRMTGFGLSGAEAIKTKIEAVMPF